MAAVQVAALALSVGLANSCTNLIITKGAATDSSSIFSYSADSGSLYGTLGHYPAGKHAAGSQRKIYDWDSGEYRGAIEEARETYNVIGNLNEHGLAIGETTFGGNETLAGGEGVMDYGSLIWITLQRAKTAREAIAMFGDLTQKHGYVSEGESFTIADPGETWILEMISKGKYEKGAVWVAVRVPDGYVSGHANQARIQHFPLDDPDNCIYAPDVITFAVKIGLWSDSKPHSEFSFSDVYDPITFSGARQSDARVWSFFSAVAEDPGFGKAYESYVLGKDVSAKSRMPLYIKPKHKISALDVMNYMRNHYEGTVLDSRFDVGAGSSGTPFRTRPISWKLGNTSYVNERTIGTQQAGWNFVAQLRSHLPAPIGGLLWFGVDDATFSVHVPFHGGVTRVPHAFADGTGDALTYSAESAFWAFNTVANFVYPRWFLAQEVIKRAQDAEKAFAQALEAEEQRALALYKSNPANALEYLTSISEARAEKTTKAEFALFGELMTKYRDGFRVSSAGPDAPDHGGAQGGVVPNVEEAGYPARWYERIVEDTGDHYKVNAGSAHPALVASKLRALSKGVVGTWWPEVSSADQPPLIV